MSTEKNIKKILARREAQKRRYYKICKTDAYKEERRRMSRERYWKKPFVRLVKAVKKQAKIEGELKPFDFWKMAKRQKLICPLTGRKLSSENISVDHIIPLSKGGKNSIDNFRLVDKYANLARLNHTDEEFFKLCQDVIRHHNLCAAPFPPSAE